MTVELVVPHTGELLDLHVAPDDLLAAVALELDALERDYADRRRRIEHELADRMAHDGQAIRHTAGGHRIDLRSGHTRQWDADDLESAVRDLADRGVISPGQYTGLIRRETRVDGRLAARLIDALTGPNRRAVEACFQWKDGTPKLTITRPEPPAIEASADDDDDRDPNWRNYPVRDD